MYKIIRFFSDSRPSKCIKYVETLEEAKNHCMSLATRGFIAPRGRVRQAISSGVSWFDGFKEVESKDEEESDE